MRRRRFLGSLAAAACPGAIAQQQADRARVVVVHPASVEESRVYQRLVPGLAQLGHVQGKTLELDLRSANGVTSALPKVVADAVATQPRIIIVVGPAAVRAAIDATKTLPIVAVDLESDPVANGWMRTLSRPGTNVTGLFLDLTGMSIKWLQLFARGDLCRQDPQIRACGRSAGRAADEVRARRQRAGGTRDLGLAVPQSLLLRADEKVR